MMSSFFWAVTHHILLGICRRFGTDRPQWNDGKDTTKFYALLHKQRRHQLHCGGCPKFRTIVGVYKYHFKDYELW